MIKRLKKIVAKWLCARGAVTCEHRIRTCATLDPWSPNKLYLNMHPCGRLTWEKTP